MNKIFDFTTALKLVLNGECVCLSTDEDFVVCLDDEGVVCVYYDNCAPEPIKITKSFYNCEWRLSDKKIKKIKSKNGYKAFCAGGNIMFERGDSKVILPLPDFFELMDKLKETYIEELAGL